MILVILLLPALFYSLFYIPYFQTKLANLVVRELSDKLKTEISIDKARIKPFHRLSLYNVLIRDEQGDSLVFVSEIDALIDSFSVTNKNIYVKNIFLDEPRLNISKYDTAFNFTFILNAFKGQKKDTVPGWRLGLGAVSIKNGRMYADYPVENSDKQERNHIEIKKFNIELDNIKTEKNFIHAEINEISFGLNNGFYLKDGNGQVTYNLGRLILNSFSLRTRRSGLNIDSLNVAVTGFDDFRKYAETSPLFVGLDKSFISDIDIKRFIPAFKVFKGKVVFSGKLKGKIANLKGKDLNIAIGDNSKLEFDFAIDGLPDFLDAFLFLDIKSLTTDITDLERLLTISNDKAFELPESFSRLGTIRYKGNLTGFISDIVAFGDFNTDLGSIKTDIGLKYKEKEKKIYFAGNVSTEEFGIGSLFGYEKNLGNITMNMTIKGSRTSAKKFMVFLDGNIDSLKYNRHSYKNIVLSGYLANQHFNGNVFVSDPNGSLYFSGKIDYSGEVPEYNFVASVEDVDLSQLNVLNSVPGAKLSCSVETNMHIKSFDDIVGYARVDNLKLESPERNFSMDSLVLVAYRVDSLKHAVLQSDLLEGEVTGVYNFRKLGGTFISIVNEFVPSLLKKKNIKKPDKYKKSNDFNFVISFKKIHDIANILMPKLDVSDEGTIMGSINSDKELVDIEGEFDYLNYGSLKTDKTSLYINAKKNNRVSVISRFRTLSIGDFVTFNNLSIHQRAAGDSLVVNVFWNNWDEKTNSGSLFTVTHFSRKSRGLFYNVNIKPSQIIANDSLWRIQPTHIYIYPEGFSIRNFRIWSGNQQVGINGYQQKNDDDDQLDMFIDNIDLGAILANKEIKNLKLNGILDSDIRIKHLFKTPLVTSNISVSRFVVNSDSIGDFRLKSGYDSENKYINLSVSVDKNGKQLLNGGGGIGIKDKYVDLELKLDSLPVAFLNMYLGHIMKNIKGTASGEASLKGTLSSPELTAKVCANDVNFEIDLLKTSYTLTDSVILEPHKMIFKDMTFRDKFGHQGYFRGTIEHTFFHDMKYNIFLEAKNIMVLNTTEKDNEDYYGTAFADGTMSLSGITNDIKIDVVAKSVGDTRIFIPLESTGNAEETDFIRFIGAEKSDNKKETDKKEEYKVDVSGMDITMDLEITPAAKIQMIFDSKVGDVMKGTGNGDIRIKIDKTGNVYFYGEYVIEQGDYMFTLQNVINKRFEINSGSTIRWDGSPYNALIDLTATYKLKASMYELVAPTLDPASASEFQKRVPINVNLILTDRLLKPNIRFEIKTPSVSNTNQNIIDEYITSEEELNRQVLSLLILNRFYAPEYARVSESTAKAGSNAAVVTTTEMLSNQLSHWLSQISNDVDIGVSYRPGDEITSDEFEVALSTQMFNNWVTLNSNVGYGNYETEDMSKIIGDFDIEVKLNRKGTIRAKAYTHTNNDIYETSPTTQGVGISFNEEFNTFGELMRRYWDKLTGKKRREKKKSKKTNKQEGVLNNNNEKKEEKQNDL
ncbi:MAG: hypothetical protein GXO47_12190 [Chlorobi bacterium]|nr:hypothetical protein [Chlorobiota bacterium]